MRRVAVTGVGVVTANGIGKDEFWNSLLNKNMVLSEVPESFEKTYRFKSRFFVPKPEFPQDGLNSMMEEMSKIAVASARLAASDANLDDYANAGVIFGVGMSSLKTGFESYVSHNGGGGRFNRMGIPMLMPNSAAAWVAIDLHATGICHTVNAACASGNVAIGEAFLSIKNGRIDTAVTGGAECLDDGTGAIMRGFDALTALTTTVDGVPKPFSNNRSGFLFNMGAGCVLILEELSKAKARGADIYAEIIDYAENNDSHSIVQMSPSGEKILDLFKITKGKQIDYINAHGTATMPNDEIEGTILKKMFRDRQPLTNSTKGIIGHSIGASGAIEAAVTALSIKNGVVHGNITDDVIDGLNLPVDTAKADIDYAISASYGFGGHNTLLLLRRYDG